MRATGIRKVIRYCCVANAAAALTLLAGVAQAAVVISDQATQNMSCSGGVCTPTAADAVLNTGDLETLLVSGNVEVTTTGSGVEARKINISDSFSWTSNNKLTLDAHSAVRIDALVAVGGKGRVAINAAAYGTPLLFGRKGHLTFKNLASDFSLGGRSYKLVGSIRALARAVARNPRNTYALANDYDAGRDGTYHEPPIGFLLNGGEFEGLGNTISNLKIRGAGDLALFSGIGEYASISNITLKDASVTLTKAGPSLIGALVVQLDGILAGAHATGSVTGSRITTAGGLVGSSSNRGQMYDDDANVTVVVGDRSNAGGLVGANGGSISECYAEGAVKGRDKDVQVGGLVGANGGSISNSYARGSAQRASDSGGLIGENTGGFGGPGVAFESYSTGEVEATGYGGGVIGLDEASGESKDTYWDTTTSGITSRSQGAGSPPNDPGLTGIKTKKLQSGLPTGFDPRIWAEDPDINNGLPYLINNPPPT